MKNKVPKLRFPEFSGEWEEYKISDSEIKVIDGDRGNHYPNANEFSLKGYCLFLNAKNVTKFGFSFKENNFISKERDCLLRKGKLQKNDLVLTTRGTIGNIANFNNKINIEHMRINSGMVILRNENLKLYSDYIYYYFLSPKMEKIITKISFGSAQPQLTVKEINNFKITFSSLPEQEKIANFLSSVDIKIEKLEKKKELLEKYKKGMMQKLFSQKLRFKDENGNDYPESEEKKLGEIIKYFNGTAFPEKYQGKKNKKYPFYKVSDMNLFLNKKEMSVSNNSISEEDCIFLKAKIALPETVIFPKVGAALLTNKRRILKNNSIFDNNIMGIIGTEKMNNLYLYYFMLTINFSLYVQEGALPSISKKIIDSLNILLPTLPEQEKIANFLSSIDKKIELIDQELEKNKEFKRGLLQQMFV